MQTLTPCTHIDAACRPILCSPMSSAHPTPPPSARSSRVKRPHSRASSTLPASPPLSLLSVIGHTSHSPFSHSLSPTSSDLAYIAGNSLLLYSHRTHTTHLLTTSRPSHTLTSASFSPDGALIALGETGTSPSLLIIDAATGERRGIIESLHSHSVRCIRWHPNLPSLLITLGEGDATPSTSGVSAGVGGAFVSEVVMVDWRAGEDRASTLLFAAALDEPAHGLGISEDGTYAVTCCDRSLTYWHLSLHQDDSHALAALDGRRLSVERQEAKLGVHKGANFVSLACGLGSTSSYTYALTNRGVLCAFTQKDRKKAAASSSPTSARSFAWEIEKWVDLRLDTGYDLTIAATPSASLLAIGGAEGKIRLFEPEALQHIATLPRPPPYIYAASSLPHSTPSPTPTPTLPGTYPPTLALSLFPDLTKLVALYADRSLVVWDIRQPKERPIGVLRSFVGHGGCIWDVTSVERRKGDRDSWKGEEEVKDAEVERRSQVPDHTIITCGADNSLRFWHLNREAVAQAKHSAGDKTRWTDQQLHCIHVTDTSPSTSSPSSTPSFASGVGVKVVLALASYTSSPSRADLLVTGDKLGVIRLFSLTSLNPLTSIQASDKEIKALDYHAARDTLIAGTRDGHLHLFDLSTLPHTPTISTLPLAHSSAITGVRVTSRGLLITISADRSIIFHLAPPPSTPPHNPSPSSHTSTPLPHPHPSYPQVSRTVLKTGTPHCLLLHPSERFVTIATSDRWLRIFDLTTYKETRQYRVECGVGGEMTAMAVDVSGTFIAVGCSDKAVYIIEWFSGTVMGSLLGHGSVVTGLAWVDDSSQLVSVGADGCVFVWKVEEKWRAVIKEAAKRAKRSSLNSSSSSSTSSSPAGVGAGLNSARRRRSALDYLNDEAEVTGESAATTISELTATSELDLLDEEDKEEKKAADSVVHSPPHPPRPALVPPLALPLIGDEHKERGAEREYKPASAPDWAKTQSQSTTPAVSVPGSSTASPSSAVVSASPSLTGREPKTSRWSLRAQSGYKMVSELDREGVEVTPSAALERRENLGDTDPSKKDADAQRESQAPAEQQPKAAHTIEEVMPAEGDVSVPAPESEEQAAAAKVQVVRETESEEVEEQLQTDSPVKRATLSVVSPASSSPPLPPRPSLLLLRSPALAAEELRDGRPSPLVPSLAGPLTVPSLSSTAGTSASPTTGLSSSTPPSANNSPSLPPRRASQPPSRSSSRPTSPFMKATISPPTAPPRTLLPSTIPEAAAEPPTDAAATLHALQSQLACALTLHQQLQLAQTSQSPSSPLATLERGLISLHDQLGQALSVSRTQEERGRQPSASTATGSGDLDALEVLSSSSVGGGGLVGRALDRYSDLLVELVMKKLEGKAEAKDTRSLR